jgi:hypothetical protein
MESENLSVLESVQNSTEVKENIAIHLKGIENFVRRTVIGYTRSKHIFSMVNYCQELIINSRDKLSNAKRHNFPL